MILSTCKKEFGSVDSCLAELLAIRWNLNIAKNLSLEQVLIQIDTKCAVDCINTLTILANCDLITSDCRALLDSFGNVVVVFLSRLYNVDAHHLVVLEKFVGSKCWIGYLPHGSVVVSFSATLA